MSDFLSEFNGKQVEFAKKYVADIVRHLKPEKRRIANEGVFALLISDVERSSVIVMQEYAHWLAAKLVRSKNFEKQIMPVCDEHLFSSVSGKNGVSILFVLEFLSRIIRAGTKLPFIGHITGDRLVPDELALRKYEACFDWT